MVNQYLSLVIPRVFPQWVDEAKIIKIFRDQNLGEIFKVSIVRTNEMGPNEMGPNEMGTNEMGPNEKGRKHPIYKAYLYFSVWFESIIVQNFQDRIYGKDKQARVVYDDPWYWTVFENTERVKLSKADKRMMRISLETYKEDARLTRTIREMKKNREFLEEQQEQILTRTMKEIKKNREFLQEQQEQIAQELAKQKQHVAEHMAEHMAEQLADHKQQMAEHLAQHLAEQNNAIQLLQDFCIKHGLEIPFWSAKHPPSAEVSTLEALSAATAVACADFVLQHEEQEHMAYNCIPYECVDSVLDQEFGDYDFIPVSSYEADWVTENPYTNTMPEQSRLCSYLGGGVEMDEMINLPMYM